MLRPAVLLWVLASLAFPTVALAAPAWLSLARADAAIAIYERNYWGDGVTVSVAECRRVSRVKVDCLAEATNKDGMRELTTDSATLLAHGIVRVHPGQFALKLVLR